MTDKDAAEVELSELDKSINEAISTTNEEPAPQEVETPEVEIPEADEVETEPEVKKEEPQEKGIPQSRVNKITAEKHNAIRRADAAEEKLKKYESAEKKPVEKPKLEDFDYDDAQYQEALIDYKVDQRAQSLQDKQKEDRAKDENDNRKKRFMENSVEFAEKHKDFEKVLSAVPTLQPSVLDAVMERKNGPELAYFLGTHLDIADQIVSMNPVAAGIKIGEISTKLAESKRIKPSSAPDPIEPLPSGGTASTERGPKGATYE